MRGLRLFSLLIGLLAVVRNAMRRARLEERRRAGPRLTAGRRDRPSGGRTVRLRLLSLLLAFALVGPVLAARTQTANAASVSVTVTILRFIELQNPDPAPGQGCCGDYYAKVRINGFSPQTGPEIDDSADISPYWTFTMSVDDSLGTIPVQIEMWDSDTFLAAPDDIMDLNPIDGVQTLTVLFNVQNGTWSGDVPANMGFSQGDGDHGQFGLTEGGEAGKILFDISLSGNGDTDGDGIPDGVERFGVRDANGNVVADMATMGADPCRKTIALEVDWMGGAADGHTHRPTDAAVNDAIAAMSAAPLPAVTQCPYAGFPKQASGIGLIVDRSNQIPEQATFPLGSLAGVRDGGNFNPARRPYFHYVLFVHDQATGDSSSGRCCIDNRDLIISLGSWANEVGTYRDQSGSMLHELGHALGLGHGGDEGRNFKPNYLSDMNYSFDPTGIPDPNIPANIDTDGNGTADQSFRLDYSRSDLNDLVKDALNEGGGIGDGTDFTSWFDPSYVTRTAQGNAGIDWNRKNGIDGSPVKVDLNADPCISSGGNGKMDTPTTGDDVVVATGAGPIIAAGPNFVCDTASTGDDSQDLAVGSNVVSDASLKTLHGWDDWNNLQFRAAMSPTAGGSAVQHGEDMTFEQAQVVKQATFALFRPDLSLTKTVDKANAVPGDGLTYTVTTPNVGTGDAKSVKVVDILPDASTDTRSVGTIEAGKSHVETFTYTVPCASADLVTLVNAATVSGTNLLNNPEVNTSNNSGTASTLVHAPVMTLVKTATSSVTAGESITYTISYENTGSGEAKAVTITDTLPVDVYYSTGLDSGAGPAPSSVVRNADGTTTLTWFVGSVAGGSGPQMIQYTARPGLLFLGGSSVANGAKVTFTNANGCTYTPVTASGSTGITVVTPTRDPLSQGFWKTHPEQWTSEVLARIQATDQRFDGADGSSPDGTLSTAEVAAVFAASGTTPNVLRSQLLATYLNLATRRINAGTAIESKTDSRLGLHNVREAALFAIATLALPLSGNSSRYADAVTVLEEINLNKSERY
jgi:uncharacterized repeat protein (TIGR01451 family)